MRRLLLLLLLLLRLLVAVSAMHTSYNTRRPASAATTVGVVDAARRTKMWRVRIGNAGVRQVLFGHGSVCDTSYPVGLLAMRVFP